MKQFYKPHNHEKWYYIWYTYDDGIKYSVQGLEFWADNKEEFNGKLMFIARNVQYNLLSSREPL